MIANTDQIIMLKSRGLLFDGEYAAIEYLKIISYIRLANYRKSMESDKMNHVFSRPLKCIIQREISPEHSLANYFNKI